MNQPQIAYAEGQDEYGSPVYQFYVNGKLMCIINILQHDNNNMPKSLGHMAYDAYSYGFLNAINIAQDTMSSQRGEINTLNYQIDYLRALIAKMQTTDS